MKFLTLSLVGIFLTFLYRTNRKYSTYLLLLMLKAEMLQVKWMYESST